MAQLNYDPKKHLDRNRYCPYIVQMEELQFTWDIVLLIQNSRSCAGKWLQDNRLWFRSREFTTLKGIKERTRQTPRSMASPSKKHKLLSTMREHYDFEKMKGRKNPYTKFLKQPVTIRLDRDTISYFKALSEETSMPYQTLINLYLRDCAVHHRRLKMKWAT